jgi:hypothetical protein
MNESTTQAPRTRKGNKKPVPRSVQVVRPIDHKGSGIITIKVGKEANDYGVHLFPAEFPGGSIGVALHKDDGETVHHVSLSADRQACSCDCPGFLHHCHHHNGQTLVACKHIDSLLALLALGHLQPPAEGPEIRLEDDLLPWSAAELARCA